MMVPMPTTTTMVRWLSLDGLTFLPVPCESSWECRPRASRLIVPSACGTSIKNGQPIDVEDSASIAFRFANGTLGNITSGYYLDRGKHLFIKVWGSKGWIEINHGTDNPLEWYSNADRKTHRFTPQPGPTGYTAFVGHVVRAATGMEKPALTPNDSLRVLRTVFAAYRAAETGQSQKIPA